MYGGYLTRFWTASLNKKVKKIQLKFHLIGTQFLFCYFVGSCLSYFGWWLSHTFSSTSHFREKSRSFTMAIGREKNGKTIVWHTIKGGEPFHSGINMLLFYLANVFNVKQYLYINLFSLSLGLLHLRIVSHRYFFLSLMDASHKSSIFN